LYIVPTVALLYLFCFIDRANIGKLSVAPLRKGDSRLTSPGNAKLAGLEKELHLKGYDYNIVLTVFYVSYIVFEIPATTACKFFGPGWFIPVTSLGFGICSIGTAFVHHRAAACGVRFLLGVFEAGMLPGIAYYMSRYFDPPTINCVGPNILLDGTEEANWLSVFPSTLSWLLLLEPSVASWHPPFSSCLTSEVFTSGA